MKVVKLDASSGYIEQVRNLGGYAFMTLEPRYNLDSPHIIGMLLSLKDLVKMVKLGVNLSIWWSPEFYELRKELLNDND